MTGAVRAGFFLMVLAAAGAGVQAQQSSPAKTANSGKKSAVKQEFGPQVMERRGDRPATAKPDGQAASQDAPHTSQAAQDAGAGQPAAKTEKFHVRQEFGPQTPARRGDRPTTATAGEQGGSPRAAEKRQEFGPSQGTKHRDAADRHKSGSQSKQEN